jgi:transcriptional regulator with XRE-family HTH domain
MQFTEKLKRLTDDMGKARVSQDAGLPNSAISNYISKEQMPRGDKALALARALKVPLEWLLDDRQDWPPPALGAPPDDRLADIKDTVLMRELARRYRRELMNMKDLIDEAENENWAAIVAKARTVKPGSAIPGSVELAVKKIASIVSAQMVNSFRFDVKVFADFLHAQLVGHDQPVESLQASALEKRHYELFKVAGFTEFITWIIEHKDSLKRPDAPGMIALLEISRMGPSQRANAGNLAAHPKPTDVAKPKKRR